MQYKCFRISACNHQDQWWSKNSKTRCTEPEIHWRPRSPWNPCKDTFRLQQNERLWREWTVFSNVCNFQREISTWRREKRKGIYQYLIKKKDAKKGCNLSVNYHFALKMRSIHVRIMHAWYWQQTFSPSINFKQQFVAVEILGPTPPSPYFLEKRKSQKALFRYKVKNLPTLK